MSTVTLHSEKKKTLVPKLRFTGFEGEWEQKSIEDLCSLQAGKFISASEIKNNYSEELFPCYGGNGLRGYTESFNYDGNFSLIGRQGALCGNITFAKNKFHATEHAIVVKVNQNIDENWMYYILNILNLNQYATGQAQPGLSVQNIKKVGVTVTNSLPEQQKIASFLSAVDEKIQQLSRKKELLEQYKKGVMQQLFSGKLRFKNENGKNYPDWEEKKLGDVGKIISGLTYSPDDINEDGVLVLRSSNVQNRRLSFYDNVYVKAFNYNPVELNDILICVRNGSKNLIGKNTIINEETVGVAFGAFMSVYRSKYNLFIFHYFDTDEYKSEVHKNLGATINSINGSDLKKFKIPFPCIEEQQKIANFLSSIDDKIEYTGQEVTQMQGFKKGLLQQMFV